MLKSQVSDVCLAVLNNENRRTDFPKYFCVAVVLPLYSSLFCLFG